MFKKLSHWKTFLKFRSVKGGFTRGILLQDFSWNSTTIRFQFWLKSEKCLHVNPRSISFFASQISIIKLVFSSKAIKSKFFQGFFLKSVMWRDFNRNFSIWWNPVVYRISTPETPLFTGFQLKSRGEIQRLNAPLLCCFLARNYHEDWFEIIFFRVSRSQI